MQGSASRLPAGQTEKRDWAGRETGRFGTSEGDGTRRANPRNPAPRGDSHKEKGPGDYPDPLDWWRRRESNPRPQDLRLWLYMLIRVFVLTGGYPTGRDNHKRSRLSFSGSAPGSFSTILRDRRPVLDAQVRLQSDGTLLVFKQRVRSCRRWQLLVCSCFYEGSYSLGMHLGFCDPRRNHVVPLVLV
jgi:hypothetical protein